MYKTFLEYTSEREGFDNFKRAVLNALDATEDALSDPLANFRKAKDLADNARNPAIVALLNQAPNKDAVISAIENARQTKISIADLLALYRAGSDGKKADSEIQDKKPVPQNKPMRPSAGQPPQPKPNAGGGGPPGLSPG